MSESHYGGRAPIFLIQGNLYMLSQPLKEDGEVEGFQEEVLGFQEGEEEVLQIEGEEEMLQLQDEENEVLQLQDGEDEVLQLQDEEDAMLHLQGAEDEVLQLQDEEDEALHFQDAGDEVPQLQDEEDEALHFQDAEDEVLQLQDEEDEEDGMLQLQEADGEGVILQLQLREEETQQLQEREYQELHLQDEEVLTYQGNEEDDELQLQDSQQEVLEFEEEYEQRYGGEEVPYLLEEVKQDDEDNGFAQSLQESGLILVNDSVEGEVVRAIKCRRCSFTTLDMEQLLVHHHQGHSSPRDTPSPPEAQPWKPSLELKIGEEQREGECVRYVCGRCGEEMASVQQCRQHMLLEHPPEDREEAASEAEEEEEEDLEEEEEEEAVSVCEHAPVASETATCGANEYWLQPRTAREVRSKLCSDRNVRCPLRRCLFRFSSESAVEQHQQCHTPPGPASLKTPLTPFTCLVCSAGFPGWPACSLHLFRAHGVALDLLRCPLCSRHTTHSAAGLARHLDKHRVAPCRRCAPQRPQGQRWYSRKKCQICSKMYANSKSLKKHIQAVHHKLKPFKCNVCGHSSATKNMLLIHQRQHTGEKPYLCEFCPYRTGDLNTRNKHRMRHTGEFPYRCQHCPYRSIQIGSLRSHFKYHHPHLPQPPCSRHPGAATVATKTS